MGGGSPDFALHRPLHRLKEEVQGPGNEIVIFGDRTVKQGTDVYESLYLQTLKTAI